MQRTIIEVLFQRETDDMREPPPRHLDRSSSKDLVRLHAARSACRSRVPRPRGPLGNASEPVTTPTTVAALL